MDIYSDLKDSISKDLQRCVEFHGHLCPGLVYGYLVAKEAADLLDLHRSHDEEVVAIAENDSCAVDGLQVILGTTAGKGNLKIENYGKNAYTILSRSHKKGYRFSRTEFYNYKGEKKEKFDKLDKAISDGTASNKEKQTHKMLKTKDLLSRPFDEVFSTHEIDFFMPPYAPLARSEACAKCGEMTMSTKMVSGKDGALLCIPCSKSESRVNS
ncbi:MAG: formylmethanofuran dehydrogenase [Deltaproteobacteria bacterium]|nr:formylmethanofuran dehydrogenase [Deltaproteobacteria bacterium]MBW1812955.1 formylmethanofuran dehydrogenase [Deltaproteobacteria bacterium]MBW1846095.1 formylmethanofuran dehydrogenase [Deltaproteobacteria bacterium]MBW2179956.1 formylmethanofuran dehydrogenase [Deltaproteobacteria bacterium]MBW2364358.1 formylmethanofuran dehydrogenase [Deltaproteobacteria bacterium]